MCLWIGCDVLDILERLFSENKCINIRIDLTRDIPVYILGKYPSLSKKERKLSLRDIIYAEDFPVIADVINDIVSGREKALNSHCRVNVGSDYHWAYLNCQVRKDTFNKTLHLTGSMIDVSEYLEDASDDNVLRQLEKKNSEKMEAIKTDTSSISDILGADYLKKIQSAFLNTKGLISALTETDGRLICSSDDTILSFDRNNYRFQKTNEVRYNHRTLAYWTIASDNKADVEANEQLLDVLSHTISQIANSMLVLYNEMENSKKASQQLGSNVEQQILLNSIYSIILETQESDEALKNALRLVGEYLKLDRIRLYSYGEGTESTLVREWAAAQKNLSEKKSFCCKDYPLLMEELNYCDTYFSNPSFEELDKLNVKSFVVSQVAENGKFTGLIFYEQLFEDRIWSNSDKKLLRNISQIIATMLIRCNMDTALKTQNEKLKKLAFTDSALDVSNRLALDNDLQVIFDKGGKGCAISLKITNMRSINEAFGHIHSDALLKKIVKYIDGMEFKGKRVYRFSGSVIMVLLRECSPEQARDFCEMTIERFRKAWIINGAEHYMEIIAGVAIYPNNADRCEDVYRTTALAMYRAGEYSKNTYAFYSDDFENDNLQQRELEQRLRTAVFNRMDGFSVSFRPISYLESGVNFSYEAQVRWVDPVLGQIPVKKLIKTAENIGIDAILDTWVIGKACEFCRKLNDKTGREDNVVTINLTIHELMHTPVHETIRSALSKYYLEGSNLVVEIPEKAQIKAYNEIASILGQLRKIGVRITIDDFAKEYASLSSLKFSFVNIIKLDARQFFNATNEFDRIMLESIVKLAHERDILVAVKHASDIAKHDVLYSYGIDLIEGENSDSIGEKSLTSKLRI